MPERAVTASVGPVANLYAWAVSAVATSMAVGNVALGAVLYAAPQRLAGASFAYITNGTVLWAHLWGAAFITFGAVALFGQYTHRRWPTRIAHVLSAIGCAYWVLAFGVAAGAPAGAYTSLTGCVAYAIIAVVHAIVAVASPHRPSGFVP